MGSTADTNVNEVLSRSHPPTPLRAQSRGLPEANLRPGVRWSEAEGKASKEVRKGID